MQKRYLLDSSILIYWKDNYPEDIFPDYWEFIQKAIDRQKFCTVPEVKVEILKSGKGDFIEKFIKKQQSSFFLTAKAERIKEVTDHLDSSNKYQAKIDQFTDSEKADLPLVAKALEFKALEFKGLEFEALKLKSSNKITVVTAEKIILGSNPDSKIKIPNVCRELNIDCISINNYLEMFRREKIKFHIVVNSTTPPALPT